VPRGRFSRALDATTGEGFGRGGFGPRGGGTPGGGDGGDTPGGGGLGANLPPPGTYGQRRSSTGAVVHALFFSYGQAEPPAPRLPAHPLLSRLFTVGSVGSSGLRYRVYMSRDPEDSGLTLVAVPLRDIDQTLSRLRVIEALVILECSSPSAWARSSSCVSDCARSTACR